MNHTLSGNLVAVKLPANLITCCDGLGADATLLLLSYFELLSLQEVSAEVAEQFILLDRMPGDDPARWKSALAELLEEKLLFAYPQEANDPQQVIFLFPGTPDGCHRLELLRQGTIGITEIQTANPLPNPEKPNIFTLYEQNIGPLTPMITEVLKADAADYPQEWLREAIQEAVTRNVRNWKYVQAILKSWKEKGRKPDHGTSQSTVEQFRELYRQQKQRESRQS